MPISNPKNSDGQSAFVYHVILCSQIFLREYHGHAFSCVQLIKTAKETALYLKSAIVQARLNEKTGAYRKCCDVFAYHSTHI